MNFNNGTLEFHSTHREQILFPLGSPHTAVVGTQVTHIARPIVRFSQNRYATNDKELAIGMIEGSGFNSDGGYFADPGSLPGELIDFWAGMKTETRRSVLLALADGATAEEAFDCIPEEETLPPEEEDDSASPYVLDCPAACGFRARGKQAPNVMWAHVLSTHPGFKNGE